MDAERREQADEHDEDEERCPSCGVVMYRQEVQCRAVVCNDCDLALERELAAFCAYAEQVRAIRAPRDE